jgi:predicted SnoaL-like aldol condensation-catalyzing enzyme
VVELYNYELWNNRRFELADELLGDTVIRHGIGETATLTHEQAVSRVTDTCAHVDRLEFQLLHIVAEGEFVAIVYEAHAQLAGQEPIVTSSMEMYRVIEGRICEVWNPQKSPGAWQ